MKLSDDSQTRAQPSSRQIVIRIKNLGHVPSFKNGKMMTRGRLITHPKKQAFIRGATDSIESQLRSYMQTIEEETMTEMQRRYLTASSMPLDDSWQVIPELLILAKKVQRGEEGAIITIEPLTPNDA